MDELVGYQTRSTQLAANVSNDGKISYCENPILGIIEGQHLCDYVTYEEQFIDSQGEITFFGLDPKKKFTENCYSLGYTGQTPVFECHISNGDCIVAIQWSVMGHKAGFLSKAPTTPDQPPVAGLLALEKITEQIKDRKAYKKAEDALFEAIGKVIFPAERKAIKLTRRKYREYLTHHHNNGTSPLKGTPVQSGIRCMIDGELCIFTAYGVMKVNRGYYGDLLMDACIRINITQSECTISLELSCNCELPIKHNFIGQPSLTGKDGSVSLHVFTEVLDTLSAHYKDQKLARKIYTAVLSILCFPDSSISLQKRWVNATELVPLICPEEEPKSSSFDRFFNDRSTYLSI